MSRTKQTITPLRRRVWIEMYGINNYLTDLRSGYWAVPCIDCGDSICHGWRMDRIGGLDGR